MNRLPARVEHLAMGVDLHPAEGKSNAAGYRIRAERRLIDFHRPIGFLRMDSQGAPAVGLGGVQRNVFLNRVIKFLYGVLQDCRARVPT